MKRIGIFSGTFDPIHDGHVWLINEAISQLKLDELLVLVEPEPRRKNDVTSLENRIKMVRLAIGSVSKATVYESKDRKVHTVKDTFVELEAKYDAELWLIMGGDVFEYVPQWDDLDSLVSKTGFFVGLRAEDDGEIAVNLMQDKLKDATVKLVASELSWLSSSKVRSFINQDEAPKGLDRRVWEYAKKQNLYS